MTVSLGGTGMLVLRLLLVASFLIMMISAVLWLFVGISHYIWKRYVRHEDYITGPRAIYYVGTICIGSLFTMMIIALIYRLLSR